MRQTSSLERLTPVHIISAMMLLIICSSSFLRRFHHDDELGAPTFSQRLSPAWLCGAQHYEPLKRSVRTRPQILMTSAAVQTSVSPNPHQNDVSESKLVRTPALHGLQAFKTRAVCRGNGKRRPCNTALAAGGLPSDSDDEASAAERDNRDLYISSAQGSCPACVFSWHLTVD